MKFLSIIIVNWNGSGIVTNCLKSIYDNLKDMDFEVLVVDNGSSDGSPELIQDQYKDVNLLKLEYN